MTTKFEDLLPDNSGHDAMLADNHNWMLNNLRRLMLWYRGMFLVIYKQHVIATFYNEVEARNWISQNHLEGQASYYHCLPGEAMYKTTIKPTVTFL